MRALAGSSLLLAFCLATGGFAQRFGSQSGFGNVVFPGTGHAPLNPSVTGFGNVVFPGTPRAPRINPGFNPFSITDPGFGRRLAGTVNPFFRPGSRIGGFGHGGGFGGGAPYAYPVYVGGGGYYEQPPVEQQPNVVVIYPQQQPPVVINQMLGGPAQAQGPSEISAGVQAYEAPARETANNPTAEPSSYYLIAFKDNSIYSALAYWIEGETLHYVTSGNNHNQVSLSLIDRPLTERLNRERRVGVHLQGK